MSVYVPTLELGKDPEEDLPAVLAFLEWMTTVSLDEDHPQNFYLAAERLLEVSAWAARFALATEREGRQCAEAFAAEQARRQYEKAQRLPAPASSPVPAPGECGQRSPQGVPCRLAAHHDENGLSKHEGYGERWS